MKMYVGIVMMSIRFTRTSRFKDTILQEGITTFISCYGDSEKWLREAVPSIKLEDDSQARLVNPDELIKRMRMTGLVLPRDRKRTSWSNSWGVKTWAWILRIGKSSRAGSKTRGATST